MSEAIFKAAIQYTSAGMSVIPVRREDKKPVVPWKEYQTNIATEEQLKTWFLNTDHNIAIITGEISNVCVVDLDGDDGIAVHPDHPGRLGHHPRQPLPRRDAPEDARQQQKRPDEGEDGGHLAVRVRGAHGRLSRPCGSSRTCPPRGRTGCPPGAGGWRGSWGRGGRRPPSARRAAAS